MRRPGPGSLERMAPGPLGLGRSVAMGGALRPTEMVWPGRTRRTWPPAISAVPCRVAVRGLLLSRPVTSRPLDPPSPVTVRGAERGSSRAGLSRGAGTAKTGLRPLVGGPSGKGSSTLTLLPLRLTVPWGSRRWPRAPGPCNPALSPPPTHQETGAIDSEIFAVAEDVKEAMDLVGNAPSGDMGNGGGAGLQSFWVANAKTSKSQ